MNRFCENCGARVNEGAKFCSSCGKRLNSGRWLYETFLRRDGRLNRWRYFKRTILAGLIEVLAVAALVFVLAILFPNEPELTAKILLLPVTLLNYYLTYGLIIRRCHDLRENSLLHSFISKDDTSIAKFIIIGSVISGILEIFEFSEIMQNFIDITVGIVSIYLIFAPGEIGTNKYGEDPLK